MNSSQRRKFLATGKRPGRSAREKTPRPSTLRLPDTFDREVVRRYSEAIALGCAIPFRFVIRDAHGVSTFGSLSASLGANYVGHGTGKGLT